MTIEDREIEPDGEHRFRAILEQSPLSIQVMSPDGRILRVNRAWEELWGVTLDQLEGYNILRDEQLVKKGIMPYIERAFAGEPAEIPPVLYDPEATIPDITRHAEPQRWTKAIIYPIKDAAGRVREVVLMHEDITAHTLAEENLKASEARYRMLFETTLDGIMLVDDEGRYVDVNESLCRILRTTREALVGSHFSQYMPLKRSKEAERAFKALRKTGVYAGEFPMRTADGGEVELEWTSRANFMPGLHFCIARDVTERKRSEQERARLVAQIEGQRGHLQAMVASVPGVVWEAWGEPDASTQSMNFVSDYVEQMLGYTVEEWLSTPNFWLTIVHPDDREEASRVASETFASGVPGTNRFRWIAKNGRVIWVETQSVTIYDKEGRPVGMRGVTLDISERKQKEATERFLAEASTALASSLDYETTLATVAHLAVPHFADWCSVDIANAEGRLARVAVAHVEPEKVAWAHEVYRRYPPDPSEPHGVYQVLRTGRSEFYPNITDEMLKQSARDEVHLTIMREIGIGSAMLVPLRARGHILGVLSFVNTGARSAFTPENLALAEDLANRAALAVDNAGLYRAERQTRQAAERTSGLLLRLQAVSASLSQALTPRQVAEAVIEQGVNTLGAHAGTVVMLSETGTELELAGTAGFPPEILEKWQRFPLSVEVPITAAVRRHEPVIIDSIGNWSQSYPLLGPLASVTGTRSLAAFPLIIEGRTTGALGLSFAAERDFNEDDRAFMTALAQQCAQALERARLYDAERRLRAEAETASRIKDEFLATVSHELRTPLTAIVGWSNILKHKMLEPQATQSAIETIERNAKAQAQIIEDLLDVSRIITGKLHLNARSVELESVISPALEALRPAAEGKGLTIRADLDKGVGAVWGDPARLQQVMWNLLSNAVKFTPRGGAVTVTLHRVASHLEIRVSDTGQGISRGFLPFVFERFRQADGTTTRAHGGLGLGLAIVRHLVEMHGGTVRAESPGEGLGATFIMELPLMTSQGVAPETLALSQRTAPAESLDCPPVLDDVRILVVDDEADARLLLTTLIEQCGGKVLAVGSAAEALEALGSFKPHVLVSDIGMPTEDGYSLMQKVRALSPEAGGKIPAIALTAYAREADRMHALAAGFQVHVAKPINPAELLAVVGGLAGISELK